MPRMTTLKFPAMAGLIGISAALAGLALWNNPSHAAPAANATSALVAAPITGAASQWLPWARDELLEPKLFQSQHGLLDVLMVAHEAPVAAFAPFRTTGWVYEICHRPADGGNHCPARDTSDNPYGGSRLQVEPGDTLKIHLVNKLPIFTLPNDPDASTNPHSMMNHMGMRDPGSAVGRSQNPTNLHTHGLLVSPHASIPGENVWGDDPFVRAFNRANGKIPAFERMMGPTVYNFIDYSYDFPTDHPSGLFWFHPHAHGLAQPQITSGMSGLLTVGHVADEICGNSKCQDAISLIPQRQLLLKDAQIESSGKLLLDQDTGFCAVDDSVGSTSRSHQGACHGGKNSPVSGLDHTGGRWIYSINGQVFPTITVGMPSGQIWRITNSSPNTTYDLNLWLPGEKREMAMQVLWIDGVNVGTDPRYGQIATPCRTGIAAVYGLCTQRLHMMPASRAEIWVGYRDAQGLPRQNPAPSQAILRTSGYKTGPTGDNFPAIDLAKVAIANGQVDMHGDGAMSARKPKPNMPGPNTYAVDTSKDATSICRPLPPGHMRRIFFNMLSESPATFGLGWEEIDETGRTVPGTFQDVEAFNPEHTPLCVQLAPGNQPEIERWQLVNLAGEDHNFHMHQVRFNVIDAPSVDGTIAPKFIGSHAQNVDSLALVHADIACDSVADWRAGRCSVHPAIVEIPFTIAGDYVFHCHILEHEDSGMMAKIQVLTNDARPTVRKK